MPGSRDRTDESYAAEQPVVPASTQRLPSDVLRDQVTSERADSLATGDQPPRWSRAELQQRLDRLPPGHPSSPRTDHADVAQPHRTVESAPNRQPAADGDDEADPDRPDYWSEAAGFLRQAEDQKRRWPVEQATPVDRSRDPAGSWRGDGNQYLGPDLHRQAEMEIARVRQAIESVTGVMREAQRGNKHGGWLEGLEHRCKGDERLKEKIAEKIAHEPDRTPAETIRGINDAIRYTFCFEQSAYSDGYWDVKQRLEARDYRMIYSENHWRDDPEYKGINTRWMTPEGQRIEVQFHTRESYHAKEYVTHWAYERGRNPLTSRSERREIEAFQTRVCAFIAVPPDADWIPDYKEEAS